MGTGGRPLGLAACLLLGACGGGTGGGGVNSTPGPIPNPAPTPAPTPTPTPTPTPPSTLSLAPTSNQTYSANATVTDVAFNHADGLVQSASVDSGPITIKYDAAAGSYTLQGGGRNQVFRASDMTPERIDGEVQYAAGNEFGAADFLTLEVIPYSKITPVFTPPKNRYVAMGYWQTNQLTPTLQQTKLYTFTYGLETPGASVPRTGFASWDTDIFGVLSEPGQETRTVEGSGRFDVDFLAGAFSTDALLHERDVVGSGSTSSPALHGGGLLTSDGFEGTVSYSGRAGPITGHFYGPSAEEIGASFVARNRYGGVLTGAMTGQRNSETAPLVNLTLLNIAAVQAVPGANYTGGVYLSPAGPTYIGLVGGGIVNLVADPVQTQTNYIRYNAETPSGAPITVDFYRPGEANTELALTYTSFATWHQKAGEQNPYNQAEPHDLTSFLVYGLEPLSNFTAASTGTATYRGVAFASGTRNGDGEHYTIGGTSLFLVDFDNMRYSGTLDLDGHDTAGQPYDFGQFNFSSTIGGTRLDWAHLHPISENIEEAITGNFYGPQGQEIGAIFSFRTGSYYDPGTIQVQGIAVAKR